MGYVLNGKYYKGLPPIHAMRNKVQSTYKNHEHNRQRKDHAREIVQPFKDGKLNPAFEEAYPEEAANYRSKDNESK